METHEVDVYRPTLTREAAGDTARTWSAATTKNVPVVLQNITAGRARRQFGIDKEISFAGTVDEGVVIATDDVLKIVAGKFGVGKNLLVLDQLNEPQTDSQVLALKETNDGPP